MTKLQWIKVFILHISPLCSHIRSSWLSFSFWRDLSSDSFLKTNVTLLFPIKDPG
ncbi:hypothetical protein MUK42_37405 [Musa troglodytarum]|uniref:Uncharacterized protein n=1 Tax=Musa troglodytarum TaxID=320322 RepID=A0A9E7EDA3_9LILI|nr:hypothetical protein MUK42_37405 [Musa troglodytarum]